MNFSKKFIASLKKFRGRKVLTYKQVAEKLGNKNLARAVGNALNKNKDPKVPCHRVIRSDGRIGGFNRGVKNKMKLLEEERVAIKKSRLI